MMRNFAIALAAIVLLWGLGGCAYPDGYYRGYYSSYSTQAYPHIVHPYNRHYATRYGPFYRPYRPLYHHVFSGYQGGYRTPLYRGPTVKYPVPRFYEDHVRHGKTRHKLIRRGHDQRVPGHHLRPHAGNRHAGRGKHIDRRAVDRHDIGPTVPVRIEHGVSIEHPKHRRDTFRKSPRHEQRRHEKAGFAAQQGHRAPNTELRGSKQHRGIRADHRLRGKQDHRRSNRDKAGFQANRRLPPSRSEFRGSARHEADRGRTGKSERRGWRSRTDDRGGGAKFCIGQRC